VVVDSIEVNFLAKEYGVDFDNVLPISYSWCRHSKKQVLAPPSGNGPVTGQLSVLAINTCPKKEKGDVARLIDPYLEGIKSAGADTELYYARDLTIFPCCGNLNCTIRTPGVCMAYDDMRWLRPKIGRADALILASPLYFDGTIGPDGATPSLKSLLFRLTPGKRPPTEAPCGHGVRTMREAVNLRRVVLVSGCGFWEIEDFYPVLTHIKALCHNTFPDFAGNIVGDHGVLLRGAMEDGMSWNDVREIARKAGIGLAKEGSATAEKGLERRAKDMHRRIVGRGMQ